MGIATSGNSRRWKKYRDIFLRSMVPAHIKRRFRNLSTDQLNSLIHILSEYQLAPEKTDASTIDSAGDQLLTRLNYCRLSMIPLVDHVKNLDGLKVLEIGCGTGSFSVALAEQGAEVYGLDIDPSYVKIAQKRCELYGLKADLRSGNATEIKEIFSDVKFDHIIFYASLEHMTTTERILSIKYAWEMLETGGLLSVAETPNRLWLTDSHTSFLPFFHWLPDDLALLYAKHSPRKEINNIPDEFNLDNCTNLTRKGRGISYHEFHLAIGSLDKLNIVNSLQEYMQQKSLIYRFIRKFSLQYRFGRMLMMYGPGIHLGFYERNLYFVMQKK